MSNFGYINLLNNANYYKIRLDGVNWSVINADQNLLFEALANLLLNEENLLYYASSKSSCMTLEETRDFINESVKNDNLKASLSDCLSCLGWYDKKILKNSNTVFQGDIAEILMSIFIDMFGISKTLISKIIFKTSRKRAVHGNDNIYYDVNKNILYFGESKFYKKLKKAISNSLTSIKQHSKRAIEFSFVKNHTNDIIAGDASARKKLQQTFETKNKKDVYFGAISYVMSDQYYMKDDIEKVIKELSSKINKIKCKDFKLIIVPILDKEKFLDFFIEKVKNYGK